MKLNSLHGSKKKNKKRLGRGIGSTKGKTSGRGHKGQKARSGVAIKSFEGGQMPLYRRLPKRGFNQFGVNKKVTAILNLSKIQKMLEKQTLKSNENLNLAFLQKQNLLNKKYKKLKVLAFGELKNKYNFEVNFISSSAKDKIEKLGGKVSLIK